MEQRKETKNTSIIDKVKALGISEVYLRTISIPLILTILKENGKI